MNDTMTVNDIAAAARLARQLEAVLWHLSAAEREFRQLSEATQRDYLDACVDMAARLSDLLNTMQADA